MTNFIQHRQHRLISSPLRALLLVLLLSTLGTAAETGRLLVNIEGIRVDQGGSLVVALFDAEGSWPKYDSALDRKAVPITGETTQCVFDSIELNRSYAVQVFHDSNANDKVDFRWFPYPRPKEGVGVSNNNRRIGPPSFDKALFMAEQKETNIRIKLGY